MPTVTAFRIANWDTPLWANPNRREGRYNTVPGRITQYWALHPLTPWAEYLRFNNIRGVDDLRDLELRVWAAKVDLPPGTREITFGTAEANGISPEALVDDDWTTCQSWAAGVSAPALIVPSAALAGTKTLVLMGERVRIGYSQEPIDLSLDTPTDPTADVGFAMADLLSYVRWRGGPHPGLDAWKRGKPWSLPAVGVS
jgi:RES domain-containing protein